MLVAPGVVDTEIAGQGPCENCACQLVGFPGRGSDVYAIIEPRPTTVDTLRYPDYLYITEHTPMWCRRKRRTR
jgi:hypothetical protein